MSSSGPHPSSTATISMEMIPTILTDPVNPLRNMPVDIYDTLTKNIDLADPAAAQYDHPMALVRRPKVGNTTGRPHPVQINSYPVAALPAKIIYQYDVSYDGCITRQIPLHQHIHSPIFLVAKHCVPNDKIA